jgi:protein-tyrosine-phosphatase
MAAVLFGWTRPCSLRRPRAREEINPAVVEAMAELGVDVSEEFPKPLTDEAVRAADVVITMGCGDACAIYPGKRYEDWELDNPTGQSIGAVRRIRDEIDRRVQSLIDDLEKTQP